LAELQARSLDEATFQAELTMAQAALEGNQAVEATRRLSNLYHLAPGAEGRRTVTQLLYQVLLAQPARWESALDRARQTRARLEVLAGERDWLQAREILEITSQDPVAAVALEQVGIEDLGAQVDSGLQALADVDHAVARAARLGQVEQHWDALATLADLPLENLPPGAGDQVIHARTEQLRALQAKADAGDVSNAPDEARVARAIVRLLPASCDDLHRWAGSRWSGVDPQAETLPVQALAPESGPSAGHEDEKQALYTQACLALSTGDRMQARQLLQQVGAYRAAQRLLKSLEET
ncbi:MAG: hypothetical protein JXM73_20575, partial [Anaerolineae bacterium]|nr:hypothetical protein [Anaerolineae bacterium]